MKKFYLKWADVEHQVAYIAAQLYQSNWRPDYIVGIHSGGSIPAVMLAKMLNIKSYSLDVRLRDGNGNCESNCWMSEDAFGYETQKNILIVDDINDTGKTIEWIKQDWKKLCMPNNPKWDHVWGQNVKVAVLVNNLSSNTIVDYHSMEINKAEENSWIVFPWEEWYKTNTR